MSLITRNAKEYRSMTAQLMSQNLPIVSGPFGIFCVLRHPNHFVLAGANNRNVIITYRFLAAPAQANRDFFFIDCMTVFFNCKYFPLYTRELLERHFAFWAKSLWGQLLRYLWHLENLVLKSKSVTLCFYEIWEWDLATRQENSSLRLKPLKSWKVWRQHY